MQPFRTNGEGAVLGSLVLETSSPYANDTERLATVWEAPQLLEKRVCLMASSNEGPPPIHPSVIERTQQMFNEEAPSNNDLLAGTFFDDSSYLGTLTRDALIHICAIQHAGPHPDRPNMCDGLRFEFARKWALSGSRDKDQLHSAVALAAMSVRFSESGDQGRASRNHNLAALLQQTWEMTGLAETLDLTIHHYRLAAHLAPPSLRARSMWITDVGVLLTNRYLRQRQSEDFEEAEQAYRQAIDLGGSSALQAVYLSNLGDFLRISTPPSHSLFDFRINRALGLQERAMAICDELIRSQVPPLQEYSMIHRNAAKAHLAAWQLWYRMPNLERAVLLLEKALTLALPRTFEYRDHLIELGSALMIRAQTLGSVDDEQRAQSIWYGILSSGSNSTEACVQLAAHLKDRARSSASHDIAMHDIQEAANLIDKAISEMPANYEHPGYLYNHRSIIYSVKFELDGDKASADLAVDSAASATAYTSSPFCWNYGLNLIQAYVDRYKSAPNQNDLDGADLMMRICGPKVPVADVSGQARKAWMTAKILRLQYDRTRELKELDECIACLENAANGFEVGNESRVLTLNDTANAWCCRFEHEPDLPSADKAVSLYNAALDQASIVSNNGGSPNISMLALGLGNVMLQRYLFWQSEPDLRSALRYYRQSIEWLDARDPLYAGRVSNLSYALRLAYGIWGDDGFLREAQDALVPALDAANNVSAALVHQLETELGNVINMSADVTENEDDLDRALEHYVRALSHEAIGISARCHTMLSKGAALTKKAGISKLTDDLDAALKCFDEVSQTVNDLSSLKILAWHGSAKALFKAYKQFDGNMDGYGLIAQEYYSAIARSENAAPALRITVASVAASLAAELSHDIDEARDLICISLKLLPQAIPLHANRLEQLRLTRRFHYVPGSAAALSLEANDGVMTAIQRLECGRALLWSRLVNQRSSLHRLDDAFPQLAHRFRGLSAEVAQQGNADNLQFAVPNTVFTAQDIRRIHKQRAAQSYYSLLDDIRQKPGFQDFL